MNCTDFKAAVAAAVERRELPGNDLATHLDACRDPACGTCWNDALLLDRAIRLWRRSQPVIDAADVVVAQVRSLPETPESTVGPVQVSSVVRGSRAAWGRSMGAIAAALAVLFAAWSLFPTQGLRTTPVARNRPGDSDNRSDGATATGRSMTQPAGLVYVEYAQGAAQVVTDAVALALGNRDEMEHPTITPIGFEWEPSWPPVGEDVDAALQDLLKSLPGDTPAI